MAGRGRTSHRSAGEVGEFLISAQVCVPRKFVLRGEPGAKQQRVVGAEGDTHPGIPKCPKRYVFRAGGDPERDIGRGAHLQRGAARCEQVRQGRILRGSHAVTDPVRVQLRQAGADAIRTGKLAAMRNGKEPGAGGDAERRCKLRGRTAALVVTEPGFR